MDKTMVATPGHYINRIARLSTRWLEPRLQELGVAVAHLPVFGALRSLGSLSQKELARRLYVEQPTMAQLLQRMERDGLIERKADTNDGRSSLIVLTPLALERAEPAREVLLEGSRQALKGFSARETATLTRLLQRVLLNMEEGLGSSESKA